MHNRYVKNPDAAILLFYDDDDFSWRYDQIKEAFRALTKKDSLQSYKSDQDFIFSIESNSAGYDL